MAFFEIKANHDESGTYLDGKQIEILDQLDFHLKAGEKMENFKFESKDLNLAISNKNSTIQTAKEVVEESTNNPEFEIMTKFDRSGQEEAASILAQAKQHVVSNYIKNPELLDKDLQQQLFENEPIEKINHDWAGKHLADAILTQKRMRSNKEQTS